MQPAASSPRLFFPGVSCAQPGLGWGTEPGFGVGTRPVGTGGGLGVTTTAPTLSVTRATGRPHRTVRVRRETPVVLRMMAAFIVLLAVLAGVAGALATVVRQSATSASWQTAEPLMVTAQTIDTSLSDADTTAAASFLQGRVEPATLQRRYNADLTTASADIAAGGAGGGIGPGRRRRHHHALDRPAGLFGCCPGGGFQRARRELPPGGGVPRRGKQPHADGHPAGGGAGVRHRGDTSGRRSEQRGLHLADRVGGGGVRRTPRRARPGAALAEWTLPPHLERPPGRRNGARARARCVGRGGAVRAGFGSGVGRAQRLSTGVDLHGCSDPRSARPGGRRVDVAHAATRTPRTRRTTSRRLPL